MVRHRSGAEDDRGLAAELSADHVVLDEALRSIGKVRGLEVEDDVVRIRIEPHPEFTQAYPDLAGEEIVVDGEDVDRVQGAQAVLGRDVDELIENWQD